MNKKRPTAAVLIIGNEILSGRTQDVNLNYIANELSVIGIDLNEARVVRDIESEIVKAVNELRLSHDYLFTTGGIGPTHDDITSTAIARAFDVELIQDAEITRRLEEHYKGREGKLNRARMRMAHIPKGASLIDNPISTAPGFKMENVFVMAGFPSIMRSMFDFAKLQLIGGKPLIIRTITGELSEGEIAEELFMLQDEFPEIEIGSYPHIRNEKLGVSVVAKGDDSTKLAELENKLINLITSKGGKIVGN